MTTSSLHTKILSDLSLHRSWAHCHNHNESKSISSDVSEKSLLIIHHLWLISPLLILSWSLSLLEGVCDADVLFRTDYFLLCYFLSFEHLVPELITIYFKKNLPWWGSRTTTLYWYSNKPLGVSLIVCLFSRVKLFCFLILMIYLTTGYWPG